MPRGNNKAKFYGVAHGHEPGVYASWDEASKQVTGMKGALHKSFGSEAEAAAWVTANAGGGGGDVGSRPAVPNRVVGVTSPPTSPNQRRTAAPSSRSFGRGMSTNANERMDDKDGDAIATEDDAVSRIPSDDAVSPKPSTSQPKPKLPPGKYLMLFDGACRGNPGASGAGALLKRDDETIDDHLKKGDVVFELATYLGDDLTNNESEYRSLIAGLRSASDLGVTHLRVKGDSKLVVSQVNGTWQVKKEHLLPLLNEARGIIKDAPFAKNFSLKHVEREFNSEADALANVGVSLGQRRGKGVNVGGGLLTREVLVGCGVLDESNADGHGIGTELGGESVSEREGARGGGGYDGNGLGGPGGRFTTLGGFASGKMPQFVRPAGFTRAISVSAAGKRPFPKVGGLGNSTVTNQQKGKHPRVDDPERTTQTQLTKSCETEKGKNVPDSVLFASLTVSRMRHANNAARFGANVLRVARFFV